MFVKYKLHKYHVSQKTKILSKQRVTVLDLAEAAFNLMEFAE